MQELLEASLNEELETYGVDIASERMSDREYEAAVRELADRQATTAAETSPAVAARVEEMRRVLAWHLHKARNLFPITLNALLFSSETASCYIIVCYLHTDSLNMHTTQCKITTTFSPLPSLIRLTHTPLSHANS